MMPNLQEIIDYLQGTCNTLNDGIQEFNPEMSDMDMTSEDWAFLNEQIFLCDQCGWWYETCERHEESDDDMCQSCGDIENETY